MTTGKELLLLLPLKEQDALVRKTMEDYFKARGLEYEEHNSHGLYYDVWVNELEFMFDLSPEDEPRPYDPGTLVIRPTAHQRYPSQRRGKVNIFDDGVYERLDELITYSRGVLTI